MTNETKRRLILSKWELRREQERDFETEIDDLKYEIAAMESALVDVKYWMHAAQFRRSWPLLRKVEDALGS